MKQTIIHAAHCSKKQIGATLIELMVGITIGLLTIAVAVATLGISRNVTTTVSDASSLQQQASHAFRIIGQQLRQAGSTQLYLSVADPSATAAGINEPLEPVAFDASFIKPIGIPLPRIVEGLDSPGSGEYSLRLRSQNYDEQIYDPKGSGSLIVASQFRDCLGQEGSGLNISSSFVLSGNNLMCAGTTTAANPILENVSDFQVRYLVQNSDNTVQISTATQVSSDWSKVFGVEVCLDLIGDIAVDIPAGATYTNCNNTPTSFGNRLHMVFRNVYQIRSQGLQGLS